MYYWRFILTLFVLFHPILSFTHRSVEGGCSLERSRDFRNFLSSKSANRNIRYAAFDARGEYRKHDNRLEVSSAGRINSIAKDRQLGNRENAFDRHRSFNGYPIRLIDGLIKKEPERVRDSGRVANAEKRISSVLPLRTLYTDRRDISQNRQNDLNRQRSLEFLGKRINFERRRSERNEKPVNVNNRENRDFRNQRFASQRTNIRRGFREQSDEISRRLARDTRRVLGERASDAENRNERIRNTHERSMHFVRFDPSKLGTSNRDSRRNTESEIDRSRIHHGLNRNTKHNTVTIDDKIIRVVEPAEIRETDSRYDNWQTLKLNQQMNNPYYRSSKEARAKSLLTLNWQMLFYTIQLMYVFGIFWHLCSRKTLKDKSSDLWNPSKSMIVKLD